MEKLNLKREAKNQTKMLIRNLTSSRSRNVARSSKFLISATHRIDRSLVKMALKREKLLSIQVTLIKKTVAPLRNPANALQNPKRRQKMKIKQNGTIPWQSSNSVALTKS